MLYLLTLILISSALRCEDLLGSNCLNCLTCTNNIPTGLTLLKFVSLIPNNITLYNRTITTLLINAPLTGTIPNYFFSFVSLTSITIINAAYTGTLPASLLGSKLESLYISTTPLSGTVPSKLFNLRQLSYISITYTKLTGTLPSLERMTSLYRASFANNRLSGSIPALPLYQPRSRVPLLISFASNSFSGTLPTVYPQHMTSFDVSYNSISGTVPRALFSNLCARVDITSCTIVLESNRFTGELPTEGGRIVYLLAARNYLEGTVPYYRACKKLDLSSNRYTSLLALPNAYATAVRQGRIDFDYRYNRLVDTSITYNNSYLNYSLIKSFPVDLDECELNIAVCVNKSYCSDGWYPRMSYTCTCERGYEMVNNICIDINECLMQYVCGSASKCINLDGSYSCCNSTSYNNVGVCSSCYSLGVRLHSNVSKFQSLRDYEIVFEHMYCLGEDSNGLGVTVSELDVFADSCEHPSNVETCRSPVGNLTEMNSALSAMSALYEQFTASMFLRDVAAKLYSLENITIELNESSIVITPSLNMSFLTAIILEIVPKIPNLKCSNVNNSTIISAQDSKYSLLGIVGLAIGLALVLMLIAALLYFFRDMDGLDILPKQVAASYIHYHSTFYSWKYRGGDDNGYYFKSVDRLNYPYVLHTLDFGKYEIEKVVLVYNRALVVNFVNYYRIAFERLTNASNIFAKKTWSNGKDASNSSLIYSKYTSIASMYSWNDSTPVTILPVCHGTSSLVAEKICETGFATLSSVDQGWYGKGMYFTSYASYCIPYISCKKDPCVIIAWVIPGNIYPVLEQHTSANNLVGCALKNGYQSHFVLTDAKGECVTSNNCKSLYNELVITQEAQVVPLCLVYLASGNMDALAAEWVKNS